MSNYAFPHLADFTCFNTFIQKFVSLQLSATNMVLDAQFGLNLSVIGLPGIIIKAKNKKFLSSFSELLVEPEHAEFRISDSLKETVLKLANEK